MFRKASIVAACALVLGLLPGVASAGINERQCDQALRIRQGWRSGELTFGELFRLRRIEAGIRAEERFFRHTGFGLSRWERRDLNRDLNRASRQIHRFKHNRRTRTT